MELLDLSGMRILVIDDNEDLLLCVKALLEAFGAEVFTERGNNGLVDQQRFDALILDLQMPETDSWELLDSIRSHPDPRVHNLPVIALTTHVSSDERDRVLAKACCAYFQKPPDRRQFLSCLKSCIEAARTGDADSASNSVC